MKQQAGALLSSIRIDRSAQRKVAVQLYMALRDIILSGALGSGARLPASRTLAKEIGVSRTTVIDAVERLIAEGMLVARVGAGTFVSDILDQQQPRPVTRDTAIRPGPAPPLSSTIAKASKAYAPRSWLPHNSGAFVTALPALDAFPMQHWARISARHLRGARDQIMGYGQPQGHQALRRAIAAHLRASRGIECRPEQIFITAGAQQAFSLIAQVLLNPNDQVWYENPGAAGARNAFAASGANIVPVDVDENGLVVSDGRTKCPDFRLAFVTPSHQQPLGHVMSLARRLELLQAAAEASAMIVEDDYDGEFEYSDRPKPPLKSIDSQGRVIYVGTFSKTLFPSLRLGFMLVPDSLVAPFDQLFAAWISTPCTATQACVADFMDEGHFATHIRIMRRLYTARHDALMDESRALPASVQVQPNTSGFHTIAMLDPALDEHRIIREAQSAGITVAGLHRYALAPLGQKALVLGFGSTSPAQIRAGIRALSVLPSLRT